MRSLPENTSSPVDGTGKCYTCSCSYDSLDRMASGPAGSVTYGDINHVHAATTLGSVPNQYASYDAMGNMTCRNTDPTSGHTCGSSPTGALMSYDNEGRLASWTAPIGTNATDGFLYDNEGNRVLQRVSTNSVTDTITFDNSTETVLSGGVTTTTKYYSASGQRIAMRTGSGFSYLLSDVLGSSTIALNSDGSTQAVQLFAPYGAVRYSQGTMPTTHNFTGQRLDSQTGLLYYGFRYYDPVSGRFVRADTTQTNAGGMDPYAYVGNNPEGRTDPTGHDDPYLIYIYEWYMTFHPGDDVYSAGRQLTLPNSAVPPGSPSKWPNPAVGTNGPGYPDIANKTLRVIWEVKTGGNMFAGMGNDYPNDRTLNIAAAQARWYAARASIIYGTQWGVGDASPWTNDLNLVIYFDTFCGGTRGTCFFHIPDGPTLAIKLGLYARGKSIQGVIQYKIVQDGDGPPVLVPVLTPVLAAEWWAMLQREREQGGIPQPAYQQLPGPSGTQFSLSNYFRLWSLNFS